LPQPHLPIPSARLQGSSLFETAVEARRQAAYAINADSRNWSTQVSVFRMLLPTLVASGDMTSQALVHNALALLLRRLGLLGEALVHMKEALPLAIFSGDHWLLQSALFNFANVLSELRRAGQTDVSADHVIALLEADCAIRNRLGVGRDSAQSELLLAYLAFEAGMFDRAEVYLSQADEIIEVNQVEVDRALAERIRGLLFDAYGQSEKAVAHFDRAITMFERAGNHASADWVREERNEALLRIGDKLAMDLPR